METATLSKRKYIHYLHEDSDGVFHIEKYPVVYSNSEFTYFKSGRRQMLGMIQTSKILDSTKNVDLSNSFTYYGAYAWEAEENSLEIINQKKAEARRRYREKLLNEKKLCVDRALTLPTAKAGGFSLHRPSLAAQGLHGLHERKFGRVPPYLLRLR